MKKLAFIVLISIACALTGCSKEKAEEGGEDMETPVTAAPTDIPTAAPTVVPTAAPTAVPTAEPAPGAEGGQSTAVDAFTQLFPDKDTGGIPGGTEINKLAGLVTDGLKGRLSEITYTYKGSKISMETLVGNRDIQQIKNPAGQEILQLVYDESEYYNYVLYLPEGYDPGDKTAKWPVIYFLHGIGEKGDDLTELLDYGVPKYIMETGGLDAIMIAPQCPGESHWADTDVEEPRLKAFLEENNAKYNIDTDRIYLTGLSMGGRGTWKQALAMPDTFAAIAVVCGRTNTYDFTGILDMPIWMFHGAVDDTVAFQNVNRIVEELYGQGQEYFKLTVYPYLSHDSWTSAYARPDLYEWLLAQNLKNRKQ
jgi:predicted esterase